jgi:hypothetical protein
LETGCWGKYFNPRGRKLKQEAGYNGIVRIFIICALRQVLSV